MITRRRFLGTSAAVGAGALLPQWLERAAAQEPAVAATTLPGTPGEHARILVVLQLSGGNDGLNTVVPYADDLYQKARPKLRLEQKDVLVLDEHTGLHPSLKALRARYDQGQVAIVQAVGYPEPNRSHFTSMAIWHAADTVDKAQRAGWLGRATDVLDARAPAPTVCLNLGNSVPFAVQREHAPVLSFDGEDSFALAADKKYTRGKEAQVAAFRRLVRAEVADGSRAARVRAAAAASLDSAEHVLDCLHSGRNQVNYPRGGPSGRLAQIAKLIDGGLATRVYYTTTSGFDTHARQKDTHSSLLAGLSDGIDTFFKDLEKSGRDQDVIVAVFSEFGRRLQENDSQGTDHGTCAPMFVIGPRVKGGLHGAAPDLGKLADRDPEFRIDFRAVYASLLEDWLSLPAEPLVGPGHARLPLLG